MRLKKLLSTGGHAATVAYAVFEEFKKRGGWELYWIGPKSEREDINFPGIESTLLPSLGVKSYSINMGRVQRKYSKHTIYSLLKIPIGFVESFLILTKVRPDVVFSVGGFVAVPVVFWANLFGIPIVLHEQTRGAGLANRISSRFAKVVLVAFEEASGEFSHKKVSVVGIPVSSEIRSIREKISEKLHKPVRILVTGGSRGSQIINTCIKNAYPILLRKFAVTHLVGRANLSFFKRLKRQKGRTIVGSATRNEMAKYYLWSDIVVSRAGANTVYELGFLGKISILIPIPWVQKNEQTENARVLENLGIAKILPQESLSPENLVKGIEEMSSNWESFVKKTPQAKKYFGGNAQEKIYKIIAGLV